ncbi:MAG: multicopper oxidase domain-containing protein [Planctomycetes bacterium]|nr:multicopper oxidase domain-containing protein [Planctomycetota bacterium]
MTRKLSLEVSLIGFKMTINGQSMDMDRIDQTVKLNDTEIWEISNPSPMVHPFHIHDIQFQILTRNGQPPPENERGWKDTVLVKQDETVREQARRPTLSWRRLLLGSRILFALSLIVSPQHPRVQRGQQSGVVGTLRVASQNHQRENRSQDESPDRSPLDQHAVGSQQRKRQPRGAHQENHIAILKQHVPTVRVGNRA